MYIGLFDVWKRILRTIGLFPADNSKYLSNEAVGSYDRTSSPEFDASQQIRVLLFRELNGQDRRLLFDSRAVRQRDSSGSSSSPLPSPSKGRSKGDPSIEKSFKLSDPQNRDYVYEWQKSSSDENLLREMIFGSVSISYHGTTFKVHTIRSTSQIMLSLVFPAPQVPTYRTGEPENEESGNWNSSVELKIDKSTENLDSYLAHSVPVNVPSRLSGQYSESRDSGSFQSVDGHSSLPTACLSPEVARCQFPRSNSYNSLQRRILRNKLTCIEMGLPKADESALEPEYARTSGQKRSKLGLAIVISLNNGNNAEDKHLKDFLFSHISLIECHLASLKNTVIRAYLNRRNFVHLMFEGSKRFQISLRNLYVTPRLQNPEWLTIISSPNHRHLSYAFLGKFANLLQSYDKKETNFFVTTLLTAVLTHHLSWVPSVIPTESKIQNTQSSHKHTPPWVDLVAKSRPYNPLSIQLSDLYGALGSPLKISKTIVKGQKKDIVYHFLRVLSYFIRCSDICYQKYEKCNEVEEEVVPKESTHPWLISSQGSSNCKIEAKLIWAESSPSTLVDSFSLPSPVPKSGLPRNVPTSHGSDSLKDNSDLIVTPTADEGDPIKPKTESAPISTTRKETLTSVDLESLGYVSLEEKIMSVTSGKRIALKEHPTNFPSSINVGAATVPKDGKENNPIIRVTCSEDTCCKCRTAKCKVCVCGDNAKDREQFSLPSFATKDSDSQNTCSTKTCVKHSSSLKTCAISVEGSSTRTDSGKFAKFTCDSSDSDAEGDHSLARRTHSPQCRTSPCVSNCPCRGEPANCCRKKGGESESTEEGYHSMEEPHSPCREGSRLSEMLRRLDSWCPESCEMKYLPGLKQCEESFESSLYHSFGWSLMAGVSDTYLSDFCLQGLTGPINENELHEDLIRISNTPMLGEPVTECHCIIADTDNWKVQVVSSNFSIGADGMGFTTVMSSLVSSICKSVLNMVQLKLPPESCIIYLEDRLQELYTRSQTLADFVQGSPSRHAKWPVP